MMTQGVKTQTANLFGSANPSVTTKGKQTGIGFDSMISNNMKLNKSNSGNKETTTVKKASYQKTDADTKKSDAVNNNSNDTEKLQKKEADTSEDKVVNKTDYHNAEEVNASKNSGNDEKNVKEELIAEIAGMLQAIQEVVMQKLNISNEEFNQLLEEQGMSVTDLLQAENLQQLLLTKNGQEDILALLTDENLAKQMNELLQEVEGIISQSNLGLTKEQIDTFLSQVEQQMQSEALEDVSQMLKGNEADAGQASDSLDAVGLSIHSSKEESTTVSTENTQDNHMENAFTEETKENYSNSKEDNSNKDLNAEEHFQTFIENLVKSSGETRFNISGNQVQVTELREIANQIIERIKVSITPDQTSLELQLNPENLGKVNLNVQSKNGVMTAQFIVQNEVTKEAIESQMHILRDTLNEQGIKVEAIEVTVSNYTFNQTGQEESQNNSSSENNKASKKITLDEAINMVDNPEEEILDNATGSIGSQVDYTA